MVPLPYHFLFLAVVPFSLEHMLGVPELCTPGKDLSFLNGQLTGGKWCLFELGYSLLAGSRGWTLV